MTERKQYCRRQLATDFFNNLLNTAYDVEMQHHNGGEIGYVDGDFIRRYAGFLGVVGELVGEGDEKTRELVAAAWKSHGHLVGETDGAMNVYERIHDELEVFYALCDRLVAAEYLILDAPSMTRIEIR